MDTNEKRIAILIDADNTSAELIESILLETGKYGKITIKRIYGDWTIQTMNSWKTKLNTHAIRPMQKFAYTKGKNSSDGAMIIDGMDILYSKTVQGYCLVSSDSDFTGLAHRIREEGVFVMGIGKLSSTPEAFIKACEIFVFSENLALKVSEKKIPHVNLQEKGKEETKVKKPEVNPELIDLAAKAHEMAKKEDETALLSTMGDAFRKIKPEFDIRTYKEKSILSIFKKLPDIYDIIIHSDGTTVSIKRKKAL